MTKKSKSRRAGGRPKKHELKRAGFIGVPVNAAEKAEITAKAGGPGHVAPFVRAAAMRRSLPVPRQIPAINQEAWSILAPLHSNLNQIAHAFNAGHGLDAPQAIDLITETLTVLKEVRFALIGQDITKPPG